VIGIRRGFAALHSVPIGTSRHFPATQHFISIERSYRFLLGEERDRAGEISRRRGVEAQQRAARATDLSIKQTFTDIADGC
jgi:hypothetical protein